MNIQEIVRSNEEAVNAVISKENYNIQSPEGKEQLAVALYDQPQAYAPVIHHLFPGLYIREAYYNAGTLVVGHEHVSEHLNILLKGKIIVTDSDGNPQLLEAPYMFTAKAGRKAGYVVEDVIWQNIYATEERDIGVLERTLFKQSDSWIKKQKQDFQESYASHEEDRQDYIKAIQEAGWTQEDVEKVVAYSEDKIPFPNGSYGVTFDKSPIHGAGMFASAPFSPDMIVAPARVDGKRTPAGYLVNHAKDPNCKAEILPNGDMVLVAIKPIRGMLGGLNGDEITLDYRQVLSINNLWFGE